MKKIFGDVFCRMAAQAARQKEKGARQSVAAKGEKR